MKDETKTKKQLIEELKELRNRIAKLKKSETERRRAEEKIQHLNLVLRAIRNVSQLIIKEKDSGRLLQGACDSFIETRGYHNAWIVLLDAAGELMAHAEAGLGREFLSMLERLKRGELTNCGRSALKQSGVVVTEDPPSACSDCPMSANYGGRGAMTVRMEHSGKVYGLVSASIPRDLAADEEEQALFGEIAGDIAFALYSIEQDQQRMRAEEALRESEERFRQFFENEPEYCYMISLEDVILNVNSAALKALGYSKEELVGKPLKTIYAPEVLPRMKQLFAKWKETGKLKNEEMVIITKEGDRRIVLLSADVLRDKDRNVLHSISVQRDITERKRFEEELRLKKEEIERWNKELTNRVEEGIKKIEEAERLALIGKLSAGIVHEINNPLYGISNYLELLSDEKEEESRKKYLNMVSHGVNIIKSITGTLLDLSQISKLNLKHVNINNLIEDALTFYIPDMRKSGVKVSTKFQKDSPDLLLDKNKIRQVFLNLISNAVESMPEGGHLEIRSKFIDNKLRISFADTGIGISHENLSRIFEPFFSDKREQGRRGIGLGLFVASNIVAVHKGEIQVESTVGKGSVFNVILPVNA